MAFTKFKVKKGIQVITEGGVSESVIPVGLILPYGSNTAPPGWLMCDGSSTSGYTELAALVGSTTPNLNGSIIMGENQAPNPGSGNGVNSPSGGLITGGTNLSTRTLNSAASTTNVHPQVNISHSHGMQSHTHTHTHTHNFPHTHTLFHWHFAPHSHAVPSGGTPATIGDHTHTGYFASANQHGPGTLGRNSNTATSTLDISYNAGSHTHPTGSGATTVSAATSSHGPTSSGSFNDIATTNTTSSTDVTSTVGGAPSPSSTFSIVQPIVGVYYIIKY